MAPKFVVLFDEKDKIVTVRVSGTATPSDHYGARAQALQLCNEKTCSRILVDLRELDTVKSTTTGFYGFGKSLAGEGEGVHFAILLPKREKSKQDVKFTMTVARNWGASSADFDSLDDAKTWLLNKA